MLRSEFSFKPTDFFAQPPREHLLGLGSIQSSDRSALPIERNMVTRDVFVLARLGDCEDVLLRFDQQLDDLQARRLEMGGRVESAIHNSISALADRDDARATVPRGGCRLRALLTATVPAAYPQIRVTTRLEAR